MFRSIEKLLISVALIGAFTIQSAIAAVPPTSAEKSYISGNIFSENSGFEEGKKGWKSSGGVFNLISSPAADIAFGVKAGSWDASAASQTLTGPGVKIPYGLDGKICTISWYYKGGDSNLKAQVWDGSNVVAESSALDTSTSFSSKKVLYFTCPTGGTTVYPRLISSADAAAIILDEFKLGQEFSPGGVVPTKSWSGTHDNDCLFNRASASFGDSTPDASCTFTEDTNQNFGTVTSYLSGSDKLPGIVFTPTAVGNQYFVCATFTDGQSANGDGAFRLTDGTTVIDSQASRPNSTLIYFSQPLCGIYNSTSTSPTTLKIETKTGVGSITITGSFTTETKSIKWNIFTLKEANESSTISIDKSGWIIDSYISGTAPDTTLSNTASLIEVTNANWTLNQRPGSSPAKIACSTTNPATGITCSVGNESLGLTFPIPTAGRYEACATVNTLNNYGSAGNAKVSWRWVETPGNAQTILQNPETSSIVGLDSNEVSNSTNVQHSTTQCNDFVFNSAGEKTLRLMYQAAISSGSVRLETGGSADGNTTPNIKITVRRKIEFADSIKFTNLVTTNRTLGLKIETAHLTNGGSCAVIDKSSDWIGSPSTCSSGLSTWAMTGWSAKPTCTCTSEGGTSRDCEFNGPITSSSATIVTSFATGTLENNNIHLICVGY